MDNAASMSSLTICQPGMLTSSRIARTTPVLCGESDNSYRRIAIHQAPRQPANPGVQTIPRAIDLPDNLTSLISEESVFGVSVYFIESKPRTIACLHEYQGRGQERDYRPKRPLLSQSGFGELPEAGQLVLPELPHRRWNLHRSSWIQNWLCADGYDLFWQPEPAFASAPRIGATKWWAPAPAESPHHPSRWRSAGLVCRGRG